MKKLLSLSLVLLLCLTMFGCADDASTGELDTVSLSMEEAVSSDALIEEEPAVESVAQSAATIVSEAEGFVGKKPANSSAVASQNETKPTTSTATPKEEIVPESVPSFEPIPIVQFSPPSNSSTDIHEHTEYTLEDFLDWFNSDEALTEEDGAYREIIEFYRKRGSLPLTFTNQTDQTVRWYKLYSNGHLNIFFDQKGGTTIYPFTPSEAEVAENGIASFLEAQGKTVYQNAEAADYQSISKESPVRFMQRTVSIASQPTNAVYWVERNEITDHITGEIERIYYMRRLHWIQDGFYVEQSFIANDTAEQALIIDEDFLASLRFEEVKLTAAPTVVSTPLETE